MHLLISHQSVHTNASSPFSFINRIFSLDSYGMRRAHQINTDTTDIRSRYSRFLCMKHSTQTYERVHQRSEQIPIEVREKMQHNMREAYLEKSHIYDGFMWHRISFRHFFKCISLQPQNWSIFSENQFESQKTLHANGTNKQTGRPERENGTKFLEHRFCKCWLGQCAWQSKAI